MPLCLEVSKGHLLLRGSMAKDGMRIFWGATLRRGVSIWPVAYLAALQEVCSPWPLLLKVGDDENGTREKRQLTGRTLGAPWTLCVFCAKLLGGPCGSYTAALGRVRSKQTLSLSRKQWVTEKEGCLEVDLVGENVSPSPSDLEFLMRVSNAPCMLNFLRSVRKYAVSAET